MKIPAGVEPAFPVFQTGVLPLDYGILVGIVNAESERIEPSAVTQFRMCSTPANSKLACSTSY